MKLIQSEPETAALKRFLQEYRADERVTSALARVEVVRAVFRAGPEAVRRARRLLNQTYQASLDAALLDFAATLGPAGGLRSLDAIHLATAHLLGGDLRAVVTYDTRMIQAGSALGMVVEFPR